MRLSLSDPPAARNTDLAHPPSRLERLQRGSLRRRCRVIPSIRTSAAACKRARTRSPAKNDTAMRAAGIQYQSPREFHFIAPSNSTEASRIARHAEATLSRGRAPTCESYSFIREAQPVRLCDVLVRRTPTGLHERRDDGAIDVRHMHRSHEVVNGTLDRHGAQPTDAPVSPTAFASPRRPGRPPIPRSSDHGRDGRSPADVRPAE